MNWGIAAWEGTLMDTHRAEEKSLGHSRSRRAGVPVPLFEVQLNLPAKGSRLVTRTLYGELKAAMIDGRLLAGTLLPPARKSEAFFGVSRNTAVQVYERLANDGYVKTRHGSGTFVAKRRSVPTAARQRVREILPDPRLNSFWMDSAISSAIGFWRDEPDPVSGSRHSRHVDFRPALVDARLFPFDVFRRVTAKRLRELERKPASHKSPQGNQGNFHLRDAIAKHISLTRAVVCQADGIVVTSGAQQGFDLLARALVTRNQTVVAIEDPGYPPMRVAFAAAGARLVPVGVDEEGLCVEGLPRDVGVICVCPSHQFPLGMTMSARRRKALVEFARHHGAVIVEDDYDGEFRYDTSPLAALRTPADADIVFYVGTFSKCMLPALRLGYIVAPEWALPTLVAVKNSLDWHCSTPIQSAVAGFIAEGHLARHVRRMRHVYRKRRQLLLSALSTVLGEWLDPVPSCYGMHIAAVPRIALDLEQVTESLKTHNVKMHTFGRYFLGTPTRTGLIFGYGAVDLPELRQGLRLLRGMLES
jgi:GntR family transcriptional regulator/MocR family aminotransferase